MVSRDYQCTGHDGPWHPCAVHSALTFLLALRSPAEACNALASTTAERTLPLPGLCGFMECFVLLSGSQDFWAASHGWARSLNFSVAQRAAAQ